MQFLLFTTDEGKNQAVLFYFQFAKQATMHRWLVASLLLQGMRVEASLSLLLTACH